MDKTAQEIVDMYTYEGPENNVENRIVALETAVCKKAFIRAMTVGILGCLVLGIGMSLTMTASNYFWQGIIIGIVGLVVVCANYPLYTRHLSHLRAQVKQQILNLASQM